MWYEKRFDELSARQLYDIYRLRNQVFIVEQACPYQDIDEIDLRAVHIFYYEEELCAYARLFEQADVIQIGRVVTPPAYRGTGLGRQLMERTMELASRYNKPIMVSAQQYLEQFYRRLGFEKTSEVYLEDGIAHQDMVYRGPAMGINETENLREVTMEDKRINKVDPVDHENKEIKSSEDYVEHDQVAKDKPETKTDVMKDAQKQVSAEIIRTELGDELKEKGC